MKYKSIGILLLVAVWDKFVRHTKTAQRGTASAFAQLLLGTTKDDFGMIPEKIRKKKDGTLLKLSEKAFETMLSHFLQSGDIHTLNDLHNDSAELLARYYFYEETTFDSQNIKGIADFEEEEEIITQKLPAIQGYENLQTIGRAWSKLKPEYVYMTSSINSSTTDIGGEIYHYAMYFCSYQKTVVAAYMGIDEKNRVIVEFENESEQGTIDRWVGSYEIIDRKFWSMELSPASYIGGKEYYILQMPFERNKIMPKELYGFNIGIGLEHEGRPTAVEVLCMQLKEKSTYEDLQKTINKQIIYQLSRKRVVNLPMNREELSTQVAKLEQVVGCYLLHVLSSTTGILKLDVAKCEIMEDFTLKAASINEGKITHYKGHITVSSHTNVYYAHFYHIDKSQNDHYFIAILIPTENQSDLYGCYAGYGLGSRPRGGRDYWCKTQKKYEDIKCEQITIDENIMENEYIKNTPFILSFFKGNTKGESDFFVSDFSKLSHIGQDNNDNISLSQNDFARLHFQSAYYYALKKDSDNVVKQLAKIFSYTNIIEKYDMEEFYLELNEGILKNYKDVIINKFPNII